MNSEDFIQQLLANAIEVGRATERHDRACHALQVANDRLEAQLAHIELVPSEETTH